MRTTLTQYRQSATDRSRPSSSHAPMPASLRSGYQQPKSPQRSSMPPAYPAQGHPESSYTQHLRSQSVAKSNGSVNGALPYPDKPSSKSDQLAERFARLRASAQTPQEDVQMRPPGDQVTRAHQDAVKSYVNGSATGPHVSVNTSVSEQLPNPPSPTYTPSRPPVQPRSSLNNVPKSTNHERPMPISSSASPATQANSRGHDLHYSDHRSDASDSPTHPVRRRRKSVNRPQETEISAQRLYDYLPLFNVLLIDVRHRESYDSGHIWSRSSMCVEPTALRQNMSAEELSDALVLSPDQEQVFFARRDEFDLVVYYDQSTATADWSRDNGRPYNPAMKFIQEALYDFNQEKPLQWAPILLKGGLDAWIDLVGNQALETSDTAHKTRIHRPISRRPVVNMPSPGLDIHRKRHHRDYNPLAPEEEKKWRERARSESIVLESQPPSENDAEPEQVNGTFLDMQNDEDFQRRYPDVAALEQRSARAAGPPSEPPPSVPFVPQYPTPPIPSQPPVPSVPSRPAPAVPRKSYSGVSERVISPSTQPKRPQLPPYIPPKLKRLPRTGLHNFGVTCYMNATIQCLSSTTPLTAFFLESVFMKFLQRDNWKGSKGLMPELYNTLLRNLWHSNDVDTIRPTNFRVSETIPS